MSEEKNIIQEDSGVVGARTIDSEDNNDSSKVNIPNNKDEKGKNSSTIDINKMQNGPSNVSIPKSSVTATHPSIKGIAPGIAPIKTAKGVLVFNGV